MNTLSIDLKNHTTQKPALYPSTDPSVNILTLTVSNYSGGALTMAAGSSKLRIGFGKLLADAEAAAITTDDTNWHITHDNTPRGAAIVLSAANSVQLDVNDSFSLNLTVPSVSEQPTSGNLTILYTGVEGVEDDETVLRFFILNPPSGKPAIPLSAGWQSDMPAVAYISPDTNELLSSSLGLFLSNTSGSPLASTEANAGSNPRFLISFPTIPRPDPNNPVPDPGKNALTYDDLAQDIWMRVNGDSINQWTLAPAYGSSNDSLIWELKPLSPGILGAGQSVEVVIDHIRTVLPPFTTAVHVQYISIPGYDDGVITLHLKKSKPAPGILTFYADDPNLDIGETASINWNTFAVSSVELSYSVDNRTIVKSSDNGDISLQEHGFKVELDHTTTFTLTAYDVSGESTQRQVTVSVNELHVSMVIQPLTVAKGDKARLSWQVTGSDQSWCTLDPGGIRLPLSDSDFPLTVDETTSYTITGYNSKSKPPVCIAQQTVSVMPVKINSFAASTNGPVDSRTFVDLSWEIEFPTRVTLEPAALVDSRHLLPVDSMAVRVFNNSTFKLTAEGLNGPVTRETQVLVNSVEITSFSASANHIMPGEPVQLSWTSNREERTWLADGQSKVEVLRNSSMTVNPRRDTTYTLTCEGPNGPVSKSVTVETQCVKIVRFTFECTSSDPRVCWYAGAEVRVVWEAQNATSAVLIDLNNGGKTVATRSGEFTLPQPDISSKRSFRLICEGPEGPAQQDMDVWIDD